MPDVLFDTAKYSLKPGERERLAKVAGILLAYPDLHVEVEGHTDSTGTADSIRGYRRIVPTPCASSYWSRVRKLGTLMLADSERINRWRQTIPRRDGNLTGA